MNLCKDIVGKIFTILFLLFTIFMYSQNYPVKYGVKAGWNYSNVNAVDGNGEPSGFQSDIIAEAYAGLAFEKQITLKSYIQLDALVSFTDRVTFLEAPIYYKYNFYKNFSFFVGPKLNYIPDNESSQPYHFRKRLGISGDIGLDYKLSSHFTIEANYSKGFTKQYDDLILTYYQARRDVYRIGVSYYFN